MGLSESSSVQFAIVTDFAGRILEVCPDTAATLNLSARALTGRRLDMFIDRDRDGLRRQMDTASRGHPVTLDTVLRPLERAPRSATISIERADSTGTIAQLYWHIALGPAVGHAKKRDAARLSQGAPSTVARPVLLVDDNTDTLELVGHTLRAEGLSVVTATRGREALGILDAEARPSVIVTDLLMPGISGWDFIGQVRRTKAYDTIPIVVISAVANPDLACGSVSAVFRKPLNPLDLADALRTLISASEDGESSRHDRG
jgi:CheY-like chemotaxis protein